MWTSNINMNQCCYILSLPYACSIAQSCPTLCGPMDCSPPGSSIHGILQVGIPEWVVISYSRGIFPTQGLNPGLLYLLHRQVDSPLLSHLEALFSMYPMSNYSFWVANLLERSCNFNICQVTWKSLSCVWLFATPWTIQSMEFSWSEYWSG